MKNLFTLILIFSTVVVFGQNLNEILDEYYKANSSEKMANMKSMKMSANMTMQGMSMTQEVSIKKPNKIRMEMNMMGQDMVMIYDGDAAYMKMPGAGFTKAPADQSMALITRSDMEGALYNYEEKGNTVTLKGEETVDGTKYYVLEVIQAAVPEMPSTWLIDANTHLLKFQRMKINQMGMTMDAENVILGYKEFGGIKMPSKMETRANGMTMVAMEITDVQMNPELNDVLFVAE